MKSPSKRHFLILILSGFALFIIGWLELYLQRKQNFIGAGINRSFLFLLINAHFIVSIILLYLIIRHSIKLFTERRKEAPGSAFKRNLFFAFTVFSVIPVVFVFVIAGQLITTSINSWFQARLSRGFESALFLHREQTHEERMRLAQMGGVVTQEFDDVADTEFCDVDVMEQRRASLEERYSQLKKYRLYIWRDLGRVCFGSMSDEVILWRAYRQTNDRSTKSLRRLFWQYVNCEKTSEHMFDFFGSLYWIREFKLHDEVGSFYFVLVYRYPENIRRPLIEIQKSLWDYEQLKSMHNSIYWNYLSTFLLMTLLILFLAIWCALYLARGISKPIQELLLAIDKMRRGDLNVNVACRETDDLWRLVSGFNEMASSLKTAYSQLEFHNEEMLMILGHIKESVFFVSNMGRILTCNVAAKKLAESFLQVDRFKNKKVNIFGDAVQKEFFACTRELRDSDKPYLAKEISFSHKGEQKTLFVYMTSITNAMNIRKNGVLVIIEDLTEVYKMNKMKTWQEAAKQMAHEIKNPLTPIQLATQRLQRKLRKSGNNDLALIDSTEIILHQVKIIKDLVSHFSQFSTMPDQQIEPLDINAVIKEIGNLYEMSYPNIIFSYELQEYIPILKADKKKLKRVFINLLDNSVRALKNIQLTEKRITIKTNFKTVRKQIEILVSDNGPGVSREVRERLFLPYVSSSNKNMGLGLAIVHEIVTKAGGSIKLLSTGNGAMFQILLPHK